MVDVCTCGASRCSLAGGKSSSILPSISPYEVHVLWAGDALACALDCDGNSGGNAHDRCDVLSMLKMRSRGAPAVR